MENLTYEQFIGNIITRSLTYAEVLCEDTTKLNVYLLTRNQHVLDYFNIHDFPFKHFDVSTKQIQAVDVLSGKAVVVNLSNAYNFTIPGDPSIISPPEVGNPIFFKYLSEKDIADIQLPFCISIQKLKEAGCYTSNTIDKDIDIKIIRFRDITQKLKFEIPSNIQFLMSDRVHMMTNNILHDYVSDDKYDLLTVRYILNCAKEEMNDIPLDTFDDIQNLLNDSEKVVNIWSKYIQRLIEQQIVKYNTEYENIIVEFVDKDNGREKEFIRLQYDKAISDIKKIDVDGHLRKFGNNTKLMLRYIPGEITLPGELQYVRMLTAYENAVLTALIKNGVNILESDLKFDYIDTIMGSNGFDDLIIQLNTTYLDQIKEIRLQQIIKHADDLVKTVENEAEELDKEDLDEIISSIRDYETYRQRIDEYTDVSSVIQYWPSILLPAPPYVSRLDTNLQSPLLLQQQP